MNSKKKLLASVVGFFVAGGGQLAVAQDSSSDEGLDWLLEEVVVTATKRETSLQDTALSVSAISADTLANFGIKSFDQILATVPGATVIEAGPGNSRVSFRGVATGTDVSGNSTTSTYIDEFPLGLGDIDIKLVDMAQIEVLKGPQGTLYGQSAMGGVMRYITKKPDFETILGGVEASGSRVASGGSGYQLQGHINVPLSERVAVRAVFYQQDNPGFIDNLGTGSEDVNSEEVAGGRLALRWAISESAELNLLYLNQSQELGGGQGNDYQTASSTYTPVLNGSPTDFMSPDLSDPSFRSNINPFVDRDFDVLNMKLDLSFDGFDLSFMGAAKQREVLGVSDGAPFLGIYDDLTILRNNTKDEFDTETFEVRLVSSGEGALEWIAGIWYEEEDGGRDRFVVFETPRTDLFGGEVFDGLVYNDWDSFDDASELAAYGEVGYQFTDKIKMTLGYRRADVELDSGFTKGDGLADGGRSALIGVDESTQEDVDTYKLHIEYVLNEDVLLHALASSGYRAGGFNRGGLLSSTSRYGSDTLWNYEVGARTSWLDNRLIVNSVAYYIDWSDIQRRAYDLVAFESRIQNLGKAEIYGFETEVSYQLMESLRLSMNYSYIDATIAEDLLDTSTTPPTVEAEKGDRLPGSSKDTFSLFVDWQAPLTSSLMLQVNANYVYVGSRPNQLGSIRPLLPDDRTIKSTEITNVNAGLSHDNGVTVSLFANNLFDERNAQYEAGGIGALETVIMNRPRTVGVRVAYDF